jgi:hypothetical protein
MQLSLHIYPDFHPYVLPQHLAFVEADEQAARPAPGCDLNSPASKAGGHEVGASSFAAG